MITLERPGSPPPPAGPGDDDGWWRGDGGAPDGSDPKLWPVLILAFGLLAIAAVLAAVLPQVIPGCHVAVITVDRPHYSWSCS